MPPIKYYECCICHKKVNYKPTRLVKQRYGVNTNYPSQYSMICNYNFCDECFKKFQNWVNKHRRNDDEE